MIQTASKQEVAQLLNYEAEQAVLGTLLADSSTAWPFVGQWLKPDHFAEHVHARIYAAIESLARVGKPASPITIKNLFDEDATLQEIGGMEYIARLVSVAAPRASLKIYAEIVKDLAARRSAISAASDLSEEMGSVKPDQSVRPLIANHIETMQRLFDNGVERRTRFTLGEASNSMLDRIERMRTGEADPNAIKIDIASIDKFTGGFHRGEYIILGARPSMGKTALACQIAHNVAREGGGVFYASLEMPAPLLTPRFASARLWSPDSATAIPYQHLLQGRLDDRQVRWLASVSKELEDWPLVIDDAPGLTASELEARVQIEKAKFERKGKSLDLVVVDHIHKMRHPGTQSKVTEFTEISSRLAEMAKRLDVPTLALAQLNRGTEVRDDKRPQLSDLRESGSIEQDADTVLFAYRPAYYLERKRCAEVGPEADRIADLEAVRHRLEVIIEKQRSGPIGSIELWCDMASNVVRDPAEVSDMEMAA